MRQSTWCRNTSSAASDEPTIRQPVQAQHGSLLEERRLTSVCKRTLRIRGVETETNACGTAGPEFRWRRAQTRGNVQAVEQARLLVKTLTGTSLIRYMILMKSQGSLSPL